MTAVALLTLGASCEIGCNEPAAIRLDPDEFATDQGTLISIADIRSVAEIMVGSMNRHPRLAALRQRQRPLKILVDDFKQRTSVAIFDKEIFINRVLASLDRWDSEDAYAFIHRASVERERRLQNEGKVDNSSLYDLVDADFVLSGELRELLTRTPEENGGELERRTIQYTLRISDVDHGVLVWTNSHEIVKQQMIGAVYR